MPNKFGLYDLIEPQLLAGFLPQQVNEYLSELELDAASLRATFDEAAVVYRGRAEFKNDSGQVEEVKLDLPSGAKLAWAPVVEFRLSVPRDGAEFLDELPAGDLKNLLDRFKPIAPTAGRGADYPGIAFRLEFQLETLYLSLGREWVPGKKREDGWIVRDEHYAKSEVKLVLPRITLEYEQVEGAEGNGFPPNINFRMKSWGQSGFEAPSDLRVGEMARMEPPLALHTSGSIALGMEEVVIDVSPDSTPADLKARFGVDDSFRRSPPPPAACRASGQARPARPPRPDRRWPASAHQVRRAFAQRPLRLGRWPGWI
jgi:hypothetical protein